MNLGSYHADDNIAMSPMVVKWAKRSQTLARLAIDRFDDVYLTEGTVPVEFFSALGGCFFGFLLGVALLYTLLSPLGQYIVT